MRLDPDVAASTLKGSTGLYAIACYPQAVGCALVEVEGGLHMAGLCTYAGQVPPLQDDALLEFVKQVGGGLWLVCAGLLCEAVFRERHDVPVGYGCLQGCFQGLDFTLHMGAKTVVLFWAWAGCQEAT